jgi:hypothetical protein
MHANNENVLVVRPVEDADDAGTRQRCPNPPEEITGELFPDRWTERLDRDALGIYLAQHVPYCATLSGRVHALQDDEDTAALAGPAFRVEALLQIGQPSPQ